MKKRVACIFLVLCMMSAFIPDMMFAAPVISVSFDGDEFGGAVSLSEEFLASASEHLFEGVSADDLLQVLSDGGQIYRNLRVQSDTEGTITYRVPVNDNDIDHIVNVLEGTQGIQPVGDPFPFTRIMYSGLPHADSIVIILLGDGFTAAQYGTWPNPASGTVLWHAYNAMNSMINTHPFGLFEDLMTVYLIHSEGVNPTGTAFGYLGSITSNGATVSGTSSTLRTYRVHQLANAIVAPANQTMIQVISNAAGGTGWAWMGWHYTLNVTTGVTSIRNASNPVGGSSTVWPNGTAWHGTFIHEFGHSFGNLVDEHDTGTRSEPRANSTAAANANVKWRHWAGHRNVLTTPTRFADGWAVPAAVSSIVGQSGCLMRASWGNRNFCGVCTADLVRRMAHISGETFHGRSPMTAASLPNTPTITISPGTTRILDSAFHGNTSLNTINIPASVNTIGDFAFIGATGLTTIANQSTTPQIINNTTFAGVTRSNVTVFIPAGTTAAYLAAGWTEFILVEPVFGLNPAAVTLTNATAQTVLSTGNTTGAVTVGALTPANANISIIPAGSGNDISVQFTGSLPNAGAPAAIVSSHNVTLTRGGVNSTLTININIPAYSPATTFGLNPAAVTLTNATTQTVVSTGNATGAVTVGALTPANANISITPAGNGNDINVQFTGSLPNAGAPAAIVSSHNVTLTRGGVNSTLTININIPAYSPANQPPHIPTRPDNGGGDEWTAPPSVPSLSTPTNVRISNTNVSWNAVNNASGYRIYVSGRAISGVITTTSFDLATLDLPAGNNAIRVRAIYNGTRFSNSARSTTVNFLVPDHQPGDPPAPREPYQNHAYVEAQLANGESAVALGTGVGVSALLLYRDTLAMLIEANASLRIMRNNRIVWLELPTEFLQELLENMWGNNNILAIDTNVISDDNHYTEVLLYGDETPPAALVDTGFVTATTSFVIYNSALGGENVEIQHFNESYAIFADLSRFELSGLNLYRITAVYDYSNIGGRINPGTKIFTINVSMAGTFTFAYVENLRRITMQLDTPTIFDLAGNAPSQIMDQLPVIQDGRTLAPVRFVAYALGAEVDWLPATADTPLTVILTLESQSITFEIGEMATGMDAPAQLMGGRTMVPLRFLSEFFGAVVSWDGDARSIEIVL